MLAAREDEGVVIRSYRSWAAAGLIACASAWTLLAWLSPAAAHAAPSQCEQVLIRMDDGVRLHGWVRRNPDSEPRPTLWEETPYGEGCPDPGNAFLDKRLEDRVNIVQISLRGTGASEGALDGYGSRDQRDIAEVGAWIRSQPWSNGRMMPTGVSARGAWIGYALGLPGVVGALPQTTCVDGYRGCLRSGGELAGGTPILAEGIVEGLVENVPTRLQNGSVISNSPLEVALALAQSGTGTLADDQNDDFYTRRITFDLLKGVKVPVMYSTDLYDYVPQGMYLAYERTPGARLSLAFGHNSPVDVITSSRLRSLVYRPVERFIERYLLQERNRAERDPEVTLLTNLGTPSGYGHSRVLVRTESSWPLPETQWARVFLAPGASGSATSLNDGTLALAPRADAAPDGAPLATATSPTGELRVQMAATGDATYGLDQYGFAPPKDAARAAFLDDLRQQEATGLTYTTPPLKQNLELTGPMVLRVFARSSAQDFDWNVRLTDVQPDGRSSWISDGQLRASLRRVDPSQSRRNAAGDIIRPWYPYDKHEPVQPGEVVEYLIEITPTSNVFQRGHRLRLDLQPVAAGYLDSSRTGGAGTITVEHNSRYPSSILLPAIPSRCQSGTPGVSGMARPAECAPCLRAAIEGDPRDCPTAAGLGSCLARRSPIGPRNIGRVRLGYSRRRMLRKVGPRPVRRTRRAYSWCVKRSRGRVKAVFGRRGRSELVLTTALAHGNRGIRPGRSARRLSAYPRRRRILRGVYRASPRSPRLIGVRAGKIRYIAVANRRLLRDRRALRTYLRAAGVRR